MCPCMHVGGQMWVMCPILSPIRTSINKFWISKKIVDFHFNVTILKDYLIRFSLRFVCPCMHVRGQTWAVWLILSPKQLRWRLRCQAKVATESSQAGQDGMEIGLGEKWVVSVTRHDQRWTGVLKDGLDRFLDIRFWIACFPLKIVVKLARDF